MKQRRGELTKLGSLFEKYRTLLVPPQHTVEKAACDVINRHIRGTLTVEQVSFTVATKTLYIKAPALLKSEIKLQQETIHEDLRRELGVARCPQCIL